MPLAIAVTGLRHCYGSRIALDGIDLRIEKGEIYGLLGPNGGGKTTLFRILSTLLEPSEGTVRILDRDLLRDAAEIRARIGVVFQNASLDLKLTVLENLRHQGHLYGLRGRALKERIESILRSVGLTDRENDRTEELSGGLRRRVDLARGLLHRPELLLFDEPSSGLDPLARRTLWDDLRKLREEQGVTALLTTHFIEEAERCDRVGILDRGRLVAQGAPDALKRSMNKDVLVIEAEHTEVLRAEIEAQVSVTTTLVDGTVRIECDDGQAMMASLYADFRERISAIRLGRPTLEDVFIRETGRPFETAEGGHAE
ncbi:MAG: ABC transporter ATP-binding protein [Gemmatimonadetes bacterium]|nr:ABC transporter ATP-binding protein [Gemmatimonadota bacterium]